MLGAGKFHLPKYKKFFTFRAGKNNYRPVSLLPHVTRFLSESSKLKLIIVWKIGSQSV